MLAAVGGHAPAEAVRGPRCASGFGPHAYGRFLRPSWSSRSANKTTVSC